MGIVEQYLIKFKTEKRRWRRAVLILAALSFLVALITTWNLRLTGITIANGAACGFEEHMHSDDCTEKLLICGETPDESETIDDSLTVSEDTMLSSEPAEIFTEPIESADEFTETHEVLVEPPTGYTEESAYETEDLSAWTDESESCAEPITEATVQTELSSADESLTETTDVTAHVHTDECYETVYVCTLKEHIHAVSCYSDATADVETAEQWEASLPELTGDKLADIVLIAQSQLGVSESERNFELSDDGETRLGITRYGQWYGNPYGGWSNMFTSFCLSYAGIGGVTLNSGAEIMRSGWEDIGRYYPVGGYEPVPGDIVFLDKNGNGTVDTTAIVVTRADGKLTVIEGDVDNTVAEVEYQADDGTVVGYGVSVPKRVMMFAAAPTASSTVVGSTVGYSSNLLNQGGSFIIYTTDSSGKHYAIDGNGNPVEVQIDSSGTIRSDVSNPSTLYWSFEVSDNYDGRYAYVIKNAVTGKYLHPYNDGPTDNGVLHSTGWRTAIYTSGSGVRFRGANQSSYILLSDKQFILTTTQSSGSVFYFGKAPSAVNLWLDGTNGNIMSCRGSDNTKYTVYSGVAAQLPSEWKSPVKYSYKLAGWVNIKTGDYYLPGDMITITEDTVLYADWVSATYDIGEYNSYVADTVSTNEFITTHVFDYSSMINLLSTNVSVNVSGSSHSETWSHVSNGRVSYKNQQTLDFSFNDHDSSGTITNLNNLNDPNKYTGGNGVYSGIYNENLGDTLFGTDNLLDPETGEGVVGKHYLGVGDHLFQINTDPSSEYYGYYYYDAKLNSASYNQSEQRFYVYDYLARTSDSANNNDEGMYSDFLPLNSPYANTNGQTVKTYNYEGDNGEYSGTMHYSYDARYDGDGSATNQVGANLWFGMRVDVQFGLPDTPGVKYSNDEYGNRDVYGNDMHFKFTGDDDVWILVDGNVVLDLGGIHQAAAGDINFSTGEVRVNGSLVGTLSGIEPGEHTLSILYLERGSSMSNCAIYFNLAPRFSLTLQKEDVLTQEILNGAQFALYNDLACTEPCNLWTSQQSYKNGDEPTNVFTIENGQVYIWGLSPSRTYYLREVAPPNSDGYESSRGIIQLTLDKNGLNSYSAAIVEELDKNGNKIPISHGFTLHGFKIDEESQAAYIVITNAQNWVTETTSIHVEKIWNDDIDHTLDSVTVYLNITDPDGTVRRIREISLSEENDWKYTWTNLPKFAQDPDTNLESDVPIQYSVSEAYFQGYSPQIQQIRSGTVTEEVWKESASFKNGEVYILKTASGYLSAQSASLDTICFVDEATAKNSPLALWTATVSNGLVRLTNRAGQSLNFNRDRWCFNATANGSKSNLTPSTGGTGLTLASSTYQNQWYTEVVYMCGPDNNGYLSGNADSNSALVLHPMVKGTSSTTVVIDGYGYQLINTPLDSETALSVTKKWNYPMGGPELYEREQVTIKLYANGVDTGRTITLSLKNNWTDTFLGLPYVDENDEVITYTVEEIWDNIDWVPSYGQVSVISGKIPTYKITVTNHYRWENGVALPSTGGVGSLIYILCGAALMIAPLVYGFSLRRRYERRSKR